MNIVGMIVRNKAIINKLLYTFSIPRNLLLKYKLLHLYA